MIQVTNKKRDEWKLARQHKDIAQIIKDNPGKGFTRYKVRQALDSGMGHHELIKAISKMYDRRKKQQEKFS